MNPLNINSDPENRNQRIETLIIPSRFCADDSVTGSGGRAIIVLPSRGNLSGDSRILLPATCVDDCYQYSPVAGCLSLIEQATFRVGDITVCQVDHGRKLYVQQSLLKHPEERQLVDSVLHGVNSCFETCSGSKRSGETSEAEVLPGQMRLVTDEYTKLEPSLKVPGLKRARPCVMNGEVFENYRLKTFYNDTSTEAGTPEFSISLQQLFPGMFKNHLSFPLHLVDRDDEIAIEIVWSRNGSWQENERAVLCPELQTTNLTGCVFPVVTQKGVDAANQRDVVKAASGGTTDVSATIKFDTDESGNTQNIRVVDPGSNYSQDDELTVSLATTDLKLVVSAHVIKDASVNNNFVIDVAGTGYTDGAALLINVNDPAIKVGCTIATDSGGVISVDIDEADVLQFPVPAGSEQFKIDKAGGDGAARARNVVQNYTAACDTLAAGKQFQVGDRVHLTADTNKTAVVLTVVDQLPTALATTSAAWVGTETGQIERTSDATITCNITALTLVNTVSEQTAMGSGGVGSYDVVSTQGKINIVTNQVRMATDLIFNDVQDEMDKKLMMEQGIVKVYTQFRNVETTIDTGSAAGYGSFNESKNTKLIGYSNEVLRNLMIAACPAGTQSNIEFENYNQPKKNPLLLDYVSRDSLKEDGVQLQLTINSVPRYSSPLSTNCHLYTEYSDMSGRPLYVPRGAYCGYLDCKQRDDQSLIKNSSQPGFQDLFGEVNSDADYYATRQFEQNERKAGFSNQSWQGINQKWMRGNLSYMGIPLKLSTGNMLNNGVKVGAQAIQIDYTYNATYNPYYNGQAVLSIFGEVERVFSLFRGKVSVSSAAE